VITVCGVSPSNWQSLFRWVASSIRICCDDTITLPFGGTFSQREVRARVSTLRINPPEGRSGFGHIFRIGAGDELGTNKTSDCFTAARR
jgi:hypothetical protein